MTYVDDGWVFTYIGDDKMSVARYDEMRESFPVKGDYLRYTGKNGYDSDREYANKFMTVGQIFRLEVCEIGSSASTFTFKELPNKNFNTVMFEKINGIT